MLKSRLLPAVIALLVAGGSTFTAEAATTAPQAVVVQPAGHPFSKAQRDQMAFEAGISPKQAEGLTVGQLGWLKERRDEDRPWAFPPVNVNPAQVHS